MSVYAYIHIDYGYTAATAHIVLYKSRFVWDALEERFHPHPSRKVAKLGKRGRRPCITPNNDQTLKTKASLFGSSLHVAGVSKFNCNLRTSRVLGFLNHSKVAETCDRMLEHSISCLFFQCSGPSSLLFPVSEYCQVAPQLIGSLANFLKA